MNLPLVLPVTGIAHEWIADFLEFESDRLNEYKQMWKSDYDIKLRLPSEKEWEEIAKRNTFLIESHKNIGQTYTDTINEKGCPLVDVLTVETCESSEEKKEEYGYVDGLVRVDAYNRTNEGLCCLFGNAAEMVQEKGIAKGGSSFHYAIETQLNKNLKYEGLQSWVGFRYVGFLEKKIKQIKIK